MKCHASSPNSLYYIYLQFKSNLEINTVSLLNSSSQQDHLKREAGSFLIIFNTHLFSQLYDLVPK